MVFHSDKECLARASSILEERGYYVFLGRRLLHVGRVRGKGVAVRALMEEPVVRGSKLVALGDTKADTDMLEIADIAGIVGSSGRSLGLMRAHYYTTPYQPPEGWRDLTSQITSTLS